ncbi:MAG: rhomboid family intramembrane serine protease [Bacteroidetes bacterium]|nr:rhomboid family intramembrane serine protease [Bacteroidota bacterium]
MSSYDRDYNRPQRGGFSFFPPVLKSLLIINVLIFLIQVFFFEGFSLGGVSLDKIVSQYFALQPIQSENFFPWQLITYQFMHGGLSHIFFNLFALWMFGADLENLWGSKRFLVFYLLCGVGAGLVQLAVQYVPGVGAYPTVGASGAIFGILLAFGLTFPDRPIIMFPIFFPIPAKYFVMIYAAINLFSGLTNANDGVAHFAHLGGALFGFILVKFGDQLRIFEYVDKFINIFSPTKVESFHSRPQSPLRHIEVHPISPTPTHTTGRGSGFYYNGQEIPQRQIDLILDKISSKGFQSLTDEEKKMLYDINKKSE